MTSTKHTKCIFYEEKPHKDSKACNVYEGCTKTCEEEEDFYCITMYKNNTKSGLQVAWAGCMKEKGSCQGLEIKHEECHLQYFKDNGDTRYFMCCCKGDLCNTKHVLNQTLMSPPPKTTQTTVLTTTQAPATRNNSIYYSVPPVICSIGFVLVLLFFWRKHKRTMDRHKRPLLNASPPTPLSTRPVFWGDLISHGQFGCVWRGSYDENDVAIKIIQAQERSSWETERTMYEDYSLVHENILKFYCAEKRRSDINMLQYWIVTQYHGNGSLSDYLHATVLDWEGMLRLMISIVNGLVFLHTENLTLDPVKPVIAHRDFKSRNVLVKDNLTCCISDFGSACQFSGMTDNDDTKAQVGTKRYMAPEVLQGAIAFQAEAFLNIDMYALALVLWELMNRCSTPTVTVAPLYQAPYEEEVGIHPTLDDMRTCVVDNNQRPKLKDEWKASQKMNEICDTIDECWDMEPDARLHAHCVLLRLRNIQQQGDSLNDGTHSEASSGFVESSFMNDEIIEISTDYKNDESSVSSTTKEPLIVDIPC